MRLPMFDVMEASIALLERRQEFYQTCAYELQELISSLLAGDALLSVSARVKKPLSLREKMLRKRLYIEYDNPYDLLNSLSDLVGLRAECRFLREEVQLYRLLCAACTLRHDDGTFSVPSNPNIRFELSVQQPQLQQNGLTIYRLDGKYHKNGVSAPFELQIKALVHVFWSEVEHQLIYKNNSYMLMDSFLRDLLYSNYERLKQIDSHLQLIYDQMQSPTPDLEALRYSNFRPVIAKTLSDVFMRHMKNELGFSVRLDGACDILAFYLISRGEKSGNPLSSLMGSIQRAHAHPFSFGDALELGGAYYSDDPFCGAIGLHISQTLNTDYDRNLFFRLLFALEEGDNIDKFSAFLEHYREGFAAPALYSALKKAEREPAKHLILQTLSELLIQYGDISMFSETVVVRLRDGIKRVCDIGCHNEQDRVHHVLEAALKAP